MKEKPKNWYRKAGGKMTISNGEGMSLGGSFVRFSSLALGGLGNWEGRAASSKFFSFFTFGEPQFGWIELILHIGLSSILGVGLLVGCFDVYFFPHCHELLSTSNTVKTVLHHMLLKHPKYKWPQKSITEHQATP